MAFTASACSREAHAVRLPASTPNAELYRVSCEDSISACRDEAREVCAGPYDVLETTGASIEPPRVTSAPGPSSTGPRYQRKKWVGQMVVACGRVPAGALTRDGARNGAPTPAPSPAPDRVCIPGATQECLGPGACRGAQACSADGQGYEPCDCGNTSVPAPSHTPRASGDAGAPTSDVAAD